MTASPQVSVRLPDGLLAQVDALVERGEYRDRSAAVRTALRREYAGSNRYSDDHYTERSRGRSR